MIENRKYRANRKKNNLICCLKKKHLIKSLTYSAIKVGKVGFSMMRDIYFLTIDKVINTDF